MSTLPTLQAGVAIVDQSGAPTQFFLTYMQQLSAGVSNSSGATMPTPAPITIATDSFGAVMAGQLPATVRVQRFLNGDDVSGRSRWFLTTVTGTISASIDQTGLVTIAALTVNSVLQVKSVRDGVTLTCNVTVNRGAAASPGSSGAVTASAFFSINSTSAAVITTADLQVTVGSSGTVTLNAPLSVSTDAVSPTGTYPVWGKWQWWDGATWQDVAAEVQSSPDCTVDSEIVGDVRPYRVFSSSDGLITINTSKTGLTVGSSQKFRLSARNGSGTRTMYFSGTASATP